MNNNTLIKHPDTDKNGGLNINETNSGASSVMYEVLSQFGKKVIQGNFVDILKFSRPAKITSPITHLIGFSNDFKFTDLMNLAAAQTDPIERMKYVTAFLISGLHLNPVLCRSKAPFNPILGETYQARKSDGTTIYLEQTSHHPPTSNLLLVGPEKNYELFGYAVVNATLTGANSLKGWREGKNIIKFKDSSMLTFTTPETRVAGLVMGNRVLNYSGTLIIKDYQNKIESITAFPFKEEGKLESIKNSVSGLFRSKQADVPLDEFIIQISQVKKETKTKELVTEGYGSWLGEVNFEGKKYWSIEDKTSSWNQENLFVLPSDSGLRSDLIALTNGDTENAQKHKDNYENTQRKDKALRLEKKN